MKLQQVTTFFWTVNLGSFGAAAEHLHTTQSTVSMRIRELERSLGVELFDRSRRQVRLTPKGRELFEYSSRLLGLVAEIEQRLAASDTVTGHVRIGVAEVVSITWLPRFIDAISQRYPRIRLEIDEGLTAPLMKDLNNGGLDLVLVPGRTPAPDMLSWSLGHVQFEWMASPQLGFGDRHYTASELIHWPLIGLKKSSFHTGVIESWFRRHNTCCQYLARCNSMSVAASMAVQGLGISYLPKPCFQRALDQGELQVVRTDAAFPAVEFIAGTALEEVSPLPVALAKLARQISDFDLDAQDAQRHHGWNDR